MATIGTFTQNENGAGFTGAVKTLTLNAKAKFVPSEGDSERGPDFRIFAGVEFGAAWRKTARETQREYLSVKLDDPPAGGGCHCDAAITGYLALRQAVRVASMRTRHMRSPRLFVPRKPLLFGACRRSGACSDARFVTEKGAVLPL